MIAGELIRESEKENEWWAQFKGGGGDLEEEPQGERALDRNNCKYMLNYI